MVGIQTKRTELLFVCKLLGQRDQFGPDFPSFRTVLVSDRGFPNKLHIYEDNLTAGTCQTPAVRPVYNISTAESVFVSNYHAVH